MASTFSALSSRCFINLAHFCVIAQQDSEQRFIHLYSFHIRSVCCVAFNASLRLKTLKNQRENVRKPKLDYNLICHDVKDEISEKIPRESSSCRRSFKFSGGEFYFHKVSSFALIFAPIFHCIEVDVFFQRALKSSMILALIYFFKIYIVLLFSSFGLLIF